MTQYKNEHLITSTPFSEVYRAQDSEGITVALKVVSPDEDRPPHCSRDELKLLKSLGASGGSSHVISLLDSFNRDLDEIVMVFPYYPLTLLPLLRHYATSHGTNPYTLDQWSTSSSSSSSSILSKMSTRTWKSELDPSAGCAIVKGIASGLAFLHSQKIIHRDLKPENIMFKSFDTSCPVIIDLGISYQYPDNFGKENASHKICQVSTSIYKAPELIFRIEDYSYELDVWSLGIVITLIFSNNCKPIFEEDDVVDLRLVSMIFQTFGTPTMETWPDARKSRTFSNMVGHYIPLPPKPPLEIIPRAPPKILDIFQKMMVYQSSDRISAANIAKLLE